VVPPSFLDMRKFFQALLDAAKEVQWKASRDPSFEPEAPRPDLDRDSVRAAVSDGLRAPRLSDASKRAIADAIAALGQRSSAATTE
jgi:hypothetical protein